MVLVVDDHEDTRRLMLRLLKTIQRTGVGVSSGCEALEYLQGHSDISCVILDYRMPGLSGLEVLRAIRTSHRLSGLCVVMYSADGWDTKQRCLDAGADGFIEKGSLDWVGLSNLVSQFCGHPDAGIPDPDRTVEGRGRVAG